MFDLSERSVALGPDEDTPPDRIAIRLHPVGAKAKGWGYEPDTRAAIEWLEAHVQPGMTVADIGTGTGILAIVAARLGATVTAFESNPAVYDIALTNHALNAPLPISFDRAFDGWDGPPFDLVVANLGNVDYEALGILGSGREVWAAPPPVANPAGLLFTEEGLEKWTRRIEAAPADQRLELYERFAEAMTEHQLAPLRERIERLERGDA